MYTKVLLCCLVAYAAAQQANLDGPPQPYSFSYDNTDEFGTRISQQETGDENNNKVGSYSYVDPNGVTRTVKYTADADGFHVVVETNEPGTKTSNPADAQYVANPIESFTPCTLPPFTVHAAPVSYATAQHVTPVTVSAQPFTIAHAPLTYTLSKSA
ncbi:hypothetical protein MTO96_004101 [Rhipicephalus appendiculatus]